MIPPNTPASSLPGPVRGPTETNSLHWWFCEERRQSMREDYESLINWGIVSDNCTGIWDVAEADCVSAVLCLKYQWLLDFLFGEQGDD